MKALKIVSLILKGFVLGISMLLPGLSGGTMAFVMNIYGKLIKELSKFRTQHLRSLLSCLKLKLSYIKQTFALFSNTWDWSFLIPLILGIILAIFIFVIFAFPLIVQYHLQFYSIIFGLILASVLQTFKQIKKTVKNIFLFVLSFAINTWLFTLEQNLFLPIEQMEPLIFFLVGFIVSSALIIPGLSGSYLLVLAGLYEKSLLALKNWDFFILFWLVAGGVLACFSIAKGMHHLLKNHFNTTMSLILGLILSSLYVIYPLPKNSIQDLLVFDWQKQIFLLYSTLSFAIFVAFNVFYEKNQKNNKY